jgi:Zn-finger nucleic acid-binding protein
MSEDNYYGLCPVCNSELGSDGEWVWCPECDKEWFDEDFVNEYMKETNYISNRQW